MQFSTGAADINALLLAPLQAVLRDVQKLLDMELDAARIEETDEDAPFDLQAHAFASSIFGQSPLQGEAQTTAFAAASDVVQGFAGAQSGKYPELSRTAATALAEPTVSSVTADASIPLAIRSENRSAAPSYSAVSAPMDLKATVKYSKIPFALNPSAALRRALSKGGPIPAWSGFALSDSLTSLRAAAPASVEPTASSASADASTLASIKPESRTAPIYTAVSAPTDLKAAVKYSKIPFALNPSATLRRGLSKGGAIPAWSDDVLSDFPASLRGLSTAPVEPTVSSAVADALIPIRPENRSGTPPYAAVSMPAKSATVDSESSASIPVSSGITLSRKQPYAQLTDRLESAALAVSPPESSDSKPTLPPIKLEVQSVQSRGPYSRRALGIPLRPRNDNAAPAPYAMPDQAHTPLPRREIEASARLAAAVEPSFQQAYLLTQTQLEERTAPEPESQSLIRNTFNVTVAMNGNGASEGADKTAMEEALMDILLTAARRHGLEL